MGPLSSGLSSGLFQPRSLPWDWCFKYRLYAAESNFLSLASISPFNSGCVHSTTHLASSLGHLMGIFTPITSILPYSLPLLIQPHPPRCSGQNPRHYPRFLSFMPHIKVVHSRHMVLTPLLASSPRPCLLPALLLWPRPCYLLCRASPSPQREPSLPEPCHSGLSCAGSRRP